MSFVQVTLESLGTHPRAPCQNPEHTAPALETEQIGDIDFWRKVGAPFERKGPVCSLKLIFDSRIISISFFLESNHVDLILSWSFRNVDLILTATRHPQDIPSGCSRLGETSLTRCHDVLPWRIGHQGIVAKHTDRIGFLLKRTQSFSLKCDNKNRPAHLVWNLEMVPWRQQLL